MAKVVEISCQVCKKMIMVNTFRLKWGAGKMCKACYVQKRSSNSMFFGKRKLI